MQPAGRRRQSNLEERPHASTLARRRPRGGVRSDLQCLQFRRRVAGRGLGRDQPGNERGSLIRWGASSGPSFDASSVSGTVVLSGWQSSGDEGRTRCGPRGFKAKYPNITLDYQPVATDYATAMAAKFSSGAPPDVFYVDRAWRPTGSTRAFSRTSARWPLSAASTRASSSGVSRCLQGPDGKIYGFPKDGNTLAMAYNTDMFTAAGLQPPTNWMSSSGGRQTDDRQPEGLLPEQHPRPGTCLHLPERRILLSDDKTQDTIDTPAVKDALTTYSAGSRAARAPDLPT